MVDHRWHQASDEQQRGPNVDGEDVIDDRGVGVHGGQPGGCRGVVDEDVDGTERIEHLFGHVGGRTYASEVGYQGQRIVAKVLDD